MIRVGHTIKKLISAFGRSQRGNVAMMTGVALPILLMVSAGAIDLHNMARVKSELQDALDAASLAAARSPYAKQTEIQRVGMDALRANMPGYFSGNPGDVGTFIITGKDKVTASATVQVKTIVANIFLPPYGKLFDDYMPMSASSEVLRASRNVEVAMALDITGSMSSPKNFMPDLISAASQLVDIVVQDDQTVYTSRVALVPYAGGVNVGSLANGFRGTLRGPTSISAVDVWDAATRTVSSVSNGSFSSNSHGLKKGDWVRLSGFSDSDLNSSAYKVSDAGTGTFKLEGVSGNKSAANNQTRRVRKCKYAQCESKITSNGHGLVTGDYVVLESMGNVSSMEGAATITRVDANNFMVPLVPSLTANAYSGTAGRSYCGSDGCQRRAFYSKAGRVSSLESSTCISERPRGNSAPSDAAPSSSNYLGRAYFESTNPCPAAVYQPLSSAADSLKSSIGAYKAGGSTAGQVGIEMAWYAVSPTFGAGLPLANRPNPIDPSATVKAVVLMTDGEFNTPFCQGVIARNSGTGSGNDWAKIDCNATNGNGFAQSVALCNAMKSQNIVIYTVGFNLGTGKGGFGIDTAYEVMEHCASSSEHFFPAADGTDLKEAFKAIGRDITRLRIAR